LGFSPAGAQAPQILPAPPRAAIPKPEPLFTQGLFFAGGTLYESAGLYGRSGLRSYALGDGSLSPGRSLDFPPAFFAEGAALAKGRILVLTWKEGAVFRVDPGSLALIDTLFLPGEGWGLTTDGERLFVSDGSDVLRVRDPLGLQEIAPPIEVTSQGRPLSGLNELEWDPLGPLIYANVYGSDLVAAIDPGTGVVRHFLDLAPLRAQALSKRRPGWPAPGVTNGLALDAGGSLFATGKHWGLLFDLGPPPRP
jgi:glutamine cyclotransferase